MCMEDVKIGRNTQSEFRIKLVERAAGVLIAPANNNRVSLTFSGNGAETYILRPNDAGFTVDAGITVTPTNPSITLTLERVGSMLFQNWYAKTVVGDANGAIVDNVLIARKSSDLKD